MIGIYKIKNKINGKIYIGQSSNIEKRWDEHKRAVHYQSQHTYEYPLYRAIRKYGIENFDFCVIEICSIENLTIREQYWIDFYNSKVPNGYNQEDAVAAKRGEKCNFAVLTDVQAKEIIRLLQNTNIPMSEIAEIYNVSGSCIEDINKGRRRVQNNIDYPVRKNTRSIAHRGEHNNFTSLNDELVMEIRRKYVFKTIAELSKEYEELIGTSGIKKICYGSTWKHLPVYKKKEKIWITYDN